ncbi:MAG: hypothetical protein IJ563_09210, partial [Selenomonadaceae bacterium]|nr:hypothetical protein [Selenomonadaceae bacterium]
MKQGLYRFFLSAFLYWLVATYTSHVFVIPAKVISLTTFLPPVLGLMWGPLAAVGVYVGGLFAVPELHDIFSTGDGIGSWLPYFGRGLWVFLAGYLPYFLWHKWQVDSEKRSFPLTVSTLWKFLIILCVTFAVTSVFRALTASAAELEAVTGLFGFGKKATIPIYIFTCFTNDFFVAIFFDLVWFFFLVSKGYAFYHTVRNPNETITAQEAQLTNDEHKALIASLKCYLIFPAVIAYLDIYQIYGMDYIETWLNFILECLT